MKLFPLSILCSALACSGIAHAEIYKHVDKDGRVTYSSEPVKDARKLQLEPLNTVPAAKARSKSGEEASTGFARVDKATQNQRDDRRRNILEDELASEHQALAAAREKLKGAQDTPEVYRTQSGKYSATSPSMKKTSASRRKRCRPTKTTSKRCRPNWRTSSKSGLACFLL